MKSRKALLISWNASITYCTGVKLNLAIPIVSFSYCWALVLMIMLNMKNSHVAIYNFMVQIHSLFGGQVIPAGYQVQVNKLCRWLYSDNNIVWFRNLTCAAINFYGMFISIFHNLFISIFHNLSTIFLLQCLHLHFTNRNRHPEIHITCIHTGFTWGYTLATRMCTCSHVLNYACTHVHVVRNFDTRTLLNTSVHSEWCMRALSYSKQDNKPTHMHTHTRTHV